MNRNKQIKNRGEKISKKLPKNNIKIADDIAFDEVFDKY